MPDVNNPVAQPLGGPSVSGTTITVDTLVASPTIINAQIRDLVAENQGYFAEDIFSTPGFSVEGGAILYTETLPQDLFLDPTQTIAPRAPGAEAPRVASLRRPPKVSRPESWSGSIEVTDEARRRNNVISIDTQFRTLSNTFADKLQTRAIETLNTAVTAWSRTVTSTVNWRAALTNGVPNADPVDLPQADFALVLNQFVTDKAGVRPDTLIIHPDDAMYLDLIYGDKLPALLSRYGLTIRETILATEGSPLFVKRGQVGTMAFEKPLDTEYQRIARRKTDEYIVEATPIFVAHDASAVVQLAGVDS